MLQVRLSDSHPTPVCVFQEALIVLVAAPPSSSGGFFKVTVLCQTFLFDFVCPLKCLPKL